MAAVGLALDKQEPALRSGPVRVIASVPTAAAAVALLLIVVFFQLRFGAYTVEFGSNADEAAHYVTARMVSEYLKAPNSPPMAFAEDYYLHYPKVAFGIWPPVYHTTLGIWMAVTSQSRQSAMLFAGLMAWIAGLVILLQVSSRYGIHTGFGSAVFFLSLPAVQRAAGAILVDMMVVVGCYLAAASFGRYIKSERWQDSASFGVVAAVAILTKYNAFCLALIPIFAVVIAGRFDLMRRGSYWLPAAITASICGPWYLAFRSWVSYAAEPYPASSEILTSLLGNSAVLLKAVGLPVLVVAIAGMVQSFSRRESADVGRNSAMLSLCLSVLVFHTFVYPLVEERYLLPAIAALVTFIPAGLKQLAVLISRRWRTPALAGLIAAHLISVNALSGVRKPELGLRRVAEIIVDRAAGDTVLISSDAIGEGGFVSEVAMREAQPKTYVVRGSKLLARTHWSGLDYERVYGSLEHLRKILDEAGVNVVVVKRSKEEFPHGADLVNALNGVPNCWDRDAQSSIHDTAIYHRAAGCRLTASKFEIDMSRTLGRKLTRSESAVR